LGRARLAACKLVAAVIHQTTSLPASSPLRTPENKDLFDTAEALKSIGDAYLVGTIETVPENWTEFWGHAQPALLGLVEALGEKGYVLQQSDFGEEGEEGKKE